MFYMEILNKRILSDITYHMFEVVNSIFNNLENTTLKREVIKATSFDEIEKVRDNIEKTYFSDDKMYLKRKHICYENGHNMFNIFTRDNGQSVYGQHKCSRCGEVEDFQHDYHA